VCPRNTRYSFKIDHPLLYSTLYTKPLEISLEEVKLLKYTSEPWYTIKIDQIFSFPFLLIEKESFPWRKINSFCEKNVARWTPHCFHPPSFCVSEAESKEKTWCMGPYAGVDYNPTLCPLQSRLQHTYHGKPYARVDRNPLPK
jgi:hypothetical protein